MCVCIYVNIHTCVPTCAHTANSDHTTCIIQWPPWFGHDLYLPVPEISIPILPVTQIIFDFPAAPQMAHTSCLSVFAANLGPNITSEVESHKYLFIGSLLFYDIDL